jgi:hypothetical protein
MSALDDLIPRVRQMLSVKSEYDDTTIRPGIVEAMQRLLRDYNFPKSVKRLTTAAPGQVQTLPFPDGVKRPLELRLMNPLDGSYTDPILRREGFTRSTLAPFPEYYWVEDGLIRLDKMLTADYGACNAVFWYQSMVPDAALQQYLLTSFPDVVKYKAVVALALELRKTEAAQAFAPMWTEAQVSIATFVNELEWNSVEATMHEAHQRVFDRYPASLPVIGVN